jgi:aminoglycoside 3-N-acetyltransferase I
MADVTTSTRTLQPGQASCLRQMRVLFGEAFEDSAHDTGQTPDDEYLNQLLARDTFVAIAAWHGDEMVGGLAGYVLPKFEQARSEFYIYDLAVAAPFRRKGIAVSLIRAAQAECRARGIDVIFVQAHVEDEPAVALYSRLGTREDVFHFDIGPEADLRGTSPGSGTP